MFSCVIENFISIFIVFRNIFQFSGPVVYLIRFIIFGPFVIFLEQRCGAVMFYLVNIQIDIRTLSACISVIVPPLFVPMNILRTLQAVGYSNRLLVLIMLISYMIGCLRIAVLIFGKCFEAFGYSLLPFFTSDQERIFPSVSTNTSFTS